MSASRSFDCLLPTGLLVPTTVPISSTFADVKHAVWAQAEKLPLFRVLKDPSSYGFQYVKPTGDILDVVDEQPVAGVVMYQPLLRLIERKGSRIEQHFNMQIGTLISKHLSDFERMRDGEVSTFRRNILKVCQEVVSARERAGFQGLALHQYPPDIVSAALPRHLKNKLDKECFMYLKVKINEQLESLLKVDINWTPTDIVNKVKSKVVGGSNRAEDYVLKVFGKEEYLLGGHKLSQYHYVRYCLTNGHEKPDKSDVLCILVLEPRATLEAKLKRPDAERTKILLAKRQKDEARRPAISDSMWFGPYAHQKFRLKIVNAHNVVCGKLFSIGVIAGIFLGDIPICKPEQTRYIVPTDNPVWGQYLEFEVAIKDIPRDARLCLTLHGVWGNPLRMKKRKNFKNEFGLAWVNMTMLDYRGSLRTGVQELAMWQFDQEDNDTLLNSLGTTIANPHRNQQTMITIEFDQFPHEMKFPGREMIGHNTRRTAPQTPVGPALMEIKSLEPVINSDPLHQYTENELSLLRKHRYHYKDDPKALSKCLRAIDWSSNEAAHEVADMLSIWAALKPEHALDLLDSAFSDQMIRSHAVQYLEPMGDDKLLSFLLQLTQVIKYENYLDCDLGRFLLRRALQNQRIGHFFFWYLRSEMHLPEVSVRFGLLLEAYCRACGSHFDELQHQTGALKIVESITDQIKDKSVKDKVGFAAKELAQANMSPMLLPLDPSIRVHKPTVKKVFGSAQKPMWVKFDNVDPNGKPYNVIFKNGDDLRQDMLTLQLIRLMDQLWQEEGLDLQMTPYECLATGDEVGLLEMVTDSATLWKIQGKVRNVLVNDDILHKWIQQENEGKEAYDQACQAFLLSCAGYCVATYVLGIADRHNDNIMVKKTGQLFHIDFGHFLGNWKTKFGVRRERVKFILVPDFVEVITQSGGQKSKKWQTFLDVCIKAFVVVRRNANLFINLLNMMLSTGIPELKSHKDVAYLRETLFLDDDEEEAKEKFRKEIQVALRDSKSVKLMWAVHGAKHG